VDLADNYCKKQFADSNVDSLCRELRMKFSETGGTNQIRLDGFSVESKVEELEMLEE